MREYKFRALDKLTGEMFYFDFTFIIDLDLEYTEIMQFTGLCDNNKKEIYEEDKVTFDEFCIGDHLHPGGNGIVKWNDDGWSIFTSHELNEKTYVGDLWEMIQNCNLKIIENESKKNE